MSVARARQSKLVTLLDLVRAPNILTAAADPISGFLLAGGASVSAGGLAAVIGMFLYAGGVTLNDVADARRDAVTRSGRPIPSGRVDRGAALGLACSLLVVGLCLTLLFPWRVTVSAIYVILAVLAYDLVLKTTPLAPIAMGACRAASFGVGVAAAAGTWSRMVVVCAVLLWLYVTSLTYFARREDRGGTSAAFQVGGVGIIVSMLATVGYGAVAGSALSCVIGIPWLLAVGSRVWGALRRPEPLMIQRAVKPAVLGVVLLHAVLLGAFVSVDAGILTAALLVPVLVLARVFRVT